MIGVIYRFSIIALLKRDNKRVFYIGQHWEKDSVDSFLSKFDSYWGSGNIWLEYVAEIKRLRPKNWRNFIHREVLYAKEGISQKALDVLEEHFIKKYKAHYLESNGGCNVLLGTANSFGSSNPMSDQNIIEKVRKKKAGRFAGKNCYWYGKHLSEETKKIISEKAKERLAKHNPNKGRKFSQETKDKLKRAARNRDKSTYKRGFHWSEEQRKKISNGVKKYFENHDAPNLGKKMSDEMKITLSKSISEYYKNNPHPWIGRHHSEETKKKISDGHKKNKSIVNN